MKKVILNIMATTGISLVALSLVATLYDGSLICIDTIFQVLGLNVVIFIGLYFMDFIILLSGFLGVILIILFILIFSKNFLC